MLAWILKGVICDLFERECPRHSRERVLHLAFRINTAGKSQALHLLLWAPCNYVGVYAGWSGILEPLAKVRNWRLLGCHDSCWRDTVTRVIEALEEQHCTSLDHAAMGYGAAFQEVYPELQAELERLLREDRNADVPFRGDQRRVWAHLTTPGGV
jgi:hypothetical protein